MTSAIADPYFLHASYYLSVLTRTAERYASGGEVEDALRIADQDWRNIDAAFNWTVAQSATRDDAATLCSKYATTVREFIHLRMTMSERVAWQESALAGSRRLMDKHSEAQHLQSLGQLFRTLRRLDDAMSNFQAAREIWESLQDYTSATVCWFDMAIAMSMTGKTRAALDIQLKALAILEQAGPPPVVLGEWYLTVGKAYRDLKDLEQAAVWFERARRLFEQDNAQEKLAKTVGNLASIHLIAGRYQQAIALFKDRLAIARRLRDRMGEQIALGNISVAELRLGLNDSARENAEHALKLANDLGDPEGIAKAYGFLAEIEEASGRYDVALQLYSKRIDMARQQKDAAGEGLALSKLSVLVDRMGRRQEAITYAASSLQILDNIGSPLAAEPRKLLRHYGVTFSSIMSWQSPGRTL